MMSYRRTSNCMLRLTMGKLSESKSSRERFWLGSYLKSKTSRRRPKKLFWHRIHHFSHYFITSLVLCPSRCLSMLTVSDRSSVHSTRWRRRFALLLVWPLWRANADAAKIKHSDLMRCLFSRAVRPSLLVASSAPPPRRHIVQAGVVEGGQKH